MPTGAISPPQKIHVVVLQWRIALSVRMKATVWDSAPFRIVRAEALLSHLGSHNGFGPSSTMTAAKLPPRPRRLTLKTE